MSEIKIIDNVEFKVYRGDKIEGDFIKPNEAVYFDGDVEITGTLKVKYLTCAGSISVHRDYVVKEWDKVWGSQKIGGYQKIGGHQTVGGSQKIGDCQEIGGYQRIGGYQKIGGHQTVGGSQKIGDCQEIGGYQRIGGYQEIGGHQTVGGSQKIGWYQEIGSYQEIGLCQEIGGCQTIGDYQGVGWYQEVGGSQEIGGSQRIGGYQIIDGDLTAKFSMITLYSKVRGRYKVEGKVFIGVCEWKEATEEDETLQCGEFVSGDVRYGKVKEVGLPLTQINRMQK